MPDRDFDIHKFHEKSEVKPRRSQLRQKLAEWVLSFEPGDSFYITQAQRAMVLAGHSGSRVPVHLNDLAEAGIVMRVDLRPYEQKVHFIRLEDPDTETKHT